MKTISSTKLLNEEYEKRKARNAAYSLRAFARDLGVSKTTIGEVINGGRRLSLQNIEVIARALELSEETINGLKSDLSQIPDGPREQLDGDDLKFIEDWYYLAILNLAKLPNARCQADWIAERLGLSLELSSMALNHLIDHGLIENRSGAMFRISKSLTTTVDIPSSSIVEHHRQSIEKALCALSDTPVEQRDFTAVTYTVNPEQMTEVKEMILHFHRKLGKFLETENASEVYRLNINFFPLTKVQPRE